MKYEYIPNSDLKVSVLCLGTWVFGGDSWSGANESDCLNAIEAAADLGINFIDTAPIYSNGQSEKIIGKIMGKKRDQWVIATKCGLKKHGDKIINDLSPKSIARQLDNSLKRLNIDCIDLYQCHWPDPDTPIRETMEALTTLLDQGKVRAIGLSNYGCEAIAPAREFGPIHALQTAFSMLHPRAADDLLPFCVEHRMAVLGYGVLAKGLLTGKFDADSRFEDARAADPEFIGARYRRNLALVASLRGMASEYGKTVTQLVINWTSGQPGLTASIIGAKLPSQVLENVGGVGWSITEEDRAHIDRLLKGMDVDA